MCQDWVLWWEYIDHLIEAVDRGGNKAFGKGIAVIRTEDALLLPRVVTEAPVLRSTWKVLNKLPLSGRWIEVTATRNHGYLHLTDNEKSSGHVTGPFIFKQVSPKRGDRTVDAKKQEKSLSNISDLHWKPKLPVSSLHRVSHSESSLFENLNLICQLDLFRKCMFTI